jgi:hypothetical protein
MGIFDQDGRITDREVWLVTKYPDGDYEICTYLRGEYQGSYPKLSWKVFPSEVAIVFI